MPINNQPTSFVRFGRALQDIVINDTEGVVDISISNPVLTIPDPDAPVYNYRGQRFGTKTHVGILYTIRRPSPLRPSQERTLQLLFDQEGRFISASHHGVKSQAEVERISKGHHSQPLGWKGISLTVALRRLHDNFHPHSVAAEVAAEAERDARYEAQQAERIQQRYEEALAEAKRNRRTAQDVLGAAATEAVLDWFLPLPKPGDRL